MPLKYLTAGESHGPELVAIIEGVPAGLALEAGAIDKDLARRQLGHGRGGRMKIEKDQVAIVAGVRHGKTIGSPICLRIKNKDWQNWQDVMSVEEAASGETVKPVTVPRPGHADFAGVMKFGHSDIRDVLERSSARETAARVAVGAVAKCLLKQFNIEILSHVVSIGKVTTRTENELGPDDFIAVDESPVRCLDPEAAKGMIAEIDRAGEAGESAGGVFEVLAFGLMTGLGSYVSGGARLGGRIGGALMSIPAIKGVEIGDGFSLSNVFGSDAHDEIFFEKGRGFYRKTNHAGGLEGGMTNGQTLIARACMKPIPTLTKPLASVELQSGEPTEAYKERSDVCAVPAAAVVGEAMVAIELAGALMDKFGGDSIRDTLEAHSAYAGRIKNSWPRE